MLQSLIYFFRWLFTATLPAGRLFGVPVRVYLLLVIVIPFFAVPYFQVGLPFWQGAVLSLIFVGVLYGSVLAHEFGHAWGNWLVGGQTEQIVLTPIGGVAVGSGADISPRAELLVVALGPAVSVLLAAAGHLALWPIGEVSIEHFWRFSLYWAVLMIAQLNTMLALFNLLFPLFPMDSARLLRAAFSLKYNPGLVTLRIAQMGVVLGIVLMMAFFTRIDLPIIGPVSIWLFIIGLLGIQASLYEQHRIRHMPVYAQSDSWGARTVFHDREIMDRARRRAREDIGGIVAAGKPSKKKRSPRPKGPAEVIEITPSRDPKDVVDESELREMLRTAVAREDFRRAAAIKRRIEELKT